MEHDDRPNYYAIIPANVRYDKNLKDKAKLLYGEITALTNKEGYCYASNNYFSKLYDIDHRSVIRLLNNLIENGYIKSEILYKDNSKEIEKRKLYLVTKSSVPSDKIVMRGSDKIVTDNNTSINIINNNKKESIKKKFIKPTLEEIKNYCIERKNGINAEAFYDFYESKDWYVGKNKMKDWMACVRTWEKRENTKKENKKIADIPSWMNMDLSPSKSSKTVEELLNELEGTLE